MTHASEDVEDVDLPPPQADDDAPSTPDEAEAPHRALVTVMGAKGGVGTTLLAANLAVQGALGHTTCLVDLDQCKGDVGGTLDLPTERSIDLLLSRLDTVDDALLTGAMQVHASGLRVLTQPYDLSELRDLEAEEVHTLLGAVKAVHDLVFVDVGSRIDVASLAAARASDEVLLVTTPDVQALRDTHRVLALFQRVGLDLDRVRLLLNRAEASGALSREEIEEQLPIPVAATISRGDAACRRADALGAPLSEVAPHATVTRDVESLWATLHGEAEPIGRFRWPWSRR